MIRVHACLPMSIPADAVWQRIGEFSALAEWHPGVLSSPLLPGDLLRRRVTLADGAEIIEHCTHRDDAARRYGYIIDRGPLPVKGYEATLAVVATGPFDCRVEWCCTFVPTDGADGGALADVLAATFSAGLAGAAAMMARQPGLRLA